MNEYSRAIKTLKLPVIGAVLVVMLSVVIIVAQTSFPFLRFEAEQSTLGVNVQAAGDPSASGGSYIYYTDPLTTPPPAGVQFFDDFSTVEAMNRYDWQVFHGGIQDPRTLPDGVHSWWGDHSMACAAPATTMPPTLGQLREVHTHPATADPGPVETIGEVAYWCGPSGPDSGHFMSSMETVGYASIAFTPKGAPLNNVRKICWDMNLNDIASWWLQLDVIPESLFQANNGDLFYEENAEVASAAHNITGDAFMFFMMRGSTRVFQPGLGIDDPDFANVFAITNFPHHDRAKRYKHCIIDNENGTITAELYGRRSATDIEIRTHRGAIPNGPVRVIFEHSNYHNSKDADHYDQFTANGKTLGDELTVHWDNVRIE